MTTPVTANRSYTFTAGPGGLQVSWVDVWFNRFEGVVMTAKSQTRVAADAFGWAPFTIFELKTDPKTEKVTKTPRSINPFAKDGTFQSASFSGPVLTVQASYQPPAEIAQHIGQVIKPLPPKMAAASVDVVRGFALGVAADDGIDPVSPPAPTPFTTDYVGEIRRPLLAGPTRALTDDELWRVQDVAANPLKKNFGVSGPQLFAILDELTGARRSAYHPDRADGIGQPNGFYGISNLTAAQLTAAGSSPSKFLAASVHGQLVITAKYLTALTPAVSGVIPVFLTLATGRSFAGANAATVLPAPLPARLRPLSSNGTTLTGADVAARVNARTDAVSAEFAHRVSANGDMTQAVS
jgi:hypothetical protein